MAENWPYPNKMKKNPNCIISYLAERDGSYKERIKRQKGPQGRKGGVLSKASDWLWDFHPHTKKKEEVGCATAFLSGCIHICHPAYRTKAHADVSHCLSKQLQRIQAKEAGAEAARIQSEQQAAEAARSEAEQQAAAAEAARIQAEQQAAAEAARIKAEQQAAAEAARIQAEQKAAAEAARIEAEQQAAAAEAARIKAEQEAAAEAARIKAEQQAAAEAARIKAEQQAAAEAAAAAKEAEEEPMQEGNAEAGAGPLPTLPDLQEMQSSGMISAEDFEKLKLDLERYELKKFEEGPTADGVKVEEEALATK